VGGGVIIVTSGRRPEKPLYAVRPGARGDITLGNGNASSAAIAWSRAGRGTYMPTPLIYDGLVYALNNDGVFDAYDVQTGQEIYRHRLKHLGSGFSASPVADAGHI
jgi:outer membrane protein assembly factor BamB